MSALTMATPTLLLWQWLLACFGCVLAGLLVHAALTLATRTWPALHGQRLVWLAAQAVVAAVTLLPFLPALDRAAMPTLIVAVPAPLAPALPSSIVRTGTTPAAVTAPPTIFTATASAVAETRTRVGASADITAATPATAITTVNPAPFTVTVAALLAWVPLLWAAIYCAGLACAVRRMLRAWRLWRGLLGGARRLSRQALGAHGGFDARQLYDIARHRVTVMETDAAVSPMLVGAWRPVLLLPRHLRDFPVIEQQMVIAHELQHRRARDPWLLGGSALVQTLLWFNPAPRWFGARLAWAVELACDRRVLAGRPPQQRKQYAGALLAQWRAQLLAPPAAALAFGGADAHTVGERIEQLRHARAPALPAAGAWTVAVMLIGVLTGGALLRPALAVGTVPALAADTSPVPAGPVVAPTAPAASASTSAPIAWHNPLDKMRVSGFFGVMRSVSPRPSQGLDLPAPVGTPVRAAAAGTVLAAGKLDENNGRYGTTVLIASGDGNLTQALYAHLDTTAVQPGAKVAAGQVIGTVGVTGFTTGPHLHFQLRQNGRAIDPATVLAGLDQHATRRALAVRRQQLGY
ncbi:UNVERIFIED_ORG: BlaR1 peptidase M56 [Zoogloea ramigera]|uniref:M23/M56 family metallopeptidase n=1 Tax=Duganella zoogloeoides TaxID=75659 RepID=A0ABZ0Y2T2_9BURK|nr:M23/M56 family metallopeptidase [Duganella zoogloeoides]WQH06201.1 M23/M56 family metallopeptidase [Duganella zoogloeoides]